ncbi:aspartyl-phosphate phosphatase Spo0E family protein [Halobacillus kuroshimensis]|uniref:Aspartyl-phosphate phosphatase Spo0E family protein n=1 Tax=Halobacillus kuroshimensis TaxID=302481 RepID=A0ABS3E1B0_9BACI|nr:MULTISPECIES: aspartyl-phosphate phosphatase Spo0E family protein [Halobacillus]MBN8237385.1 aspartyl-phosphate phosphatase Spo0E family protein [Halobacillus kuroshimensis]
MTRVTSLTEEIEACRLEMSRLARLHHLTSPEVVKVSVKLDQLLNEYDEVQHKKQQPALSKAGYC